ncbi:MAG: hypothetical protein LAO51_04465 [Acidobacteriia bacterium]|nr:hypothetical protein [Terriglobia bacterium]
MKKGCLIVLAVIGGISVLGIGACVVLSVVWTGLSQVSPTTRTVFYGVVAPDCGASVTYSAAGGSSEQQDVRSGWQHRWGGRTGDWIYLSAQNKCDYGTVTVTIYVDDKFFRSASSDGAYKIATASGTLP